MGDRHRQVSIVLGYIVRRVLWLIPVLFVVTVITFLMMHAAPGGPFTTLSGNRPMPPQLRALLDAKYGLDDPMWEQYARWVGGLLHGDLGPSYQYRDRTVNDIVAQGIGVTVQLGIQAFLLTIVIGIPLGTIAALRHNRMPDYAATAISMLGIATPSFILASLLILVFSVTLHWLPTGGWRGPPSWILPTVALAGFPIAQVARYTRASLLEVTHRDYVRTAQSKGIRERSIVVIHLMRNALIPVVTILGPLLAFLVTGSFVIETIFNLPGIGRFYVLSINQRDYGVLMAMVVLFAFAVAVMNLVVDALYAYIDPRIRYS
jgi:oligopeptide transport system permease protein